MNDLISRKALLAALEQEREECEDAMVTPSFWSALRLVKEQPTAYDVEKVVERIQKIGVGGECRNYCEKYDWTVGACTGECTGYVIGKAVEIVQNGGKE